MPGSDLTYFRANYNNRFYKPLDEDETWIFALRGRAGYGDSWGDNQYPFFKISMPAVLKACEAIPTTRWVHRIPMKIPLAAT